MCHYSFLNEHFFELWLRSKKKEYMAEGAKLIGAGCATIALAGAGAGIGIVFGSFITVSEAYKALDKIKKVNREIN